MIHDNYGIDGYSFHSFDSKRKNGAPIRLKPVYGLLFLLSYYIISSAVYFGNRREEVLIMVSREVTISSKTGLSQDGGQADPKASEYESNIWIQKEERKANAKKPAGASFPGNQSGDRITIITDGRDEETALNELEAFQKRNDRLMRIEPSLGQLLSSCIK